MIADLLQLPFSDPAIYNELAGSWQVVLNNVEQALELTQAGHSGNDHGRGQHNGRGYGGHGGRG